MKEIKQNEKGFTLVELVVVIAILAVLAALLVPRIIGNVNDASDSRELADARTIASEVTTHNALVRVDPSAGPTIPAALPAAGTTTTLTDAMLSPIGRDSDGTIAGMNTHSIVVDSDGNATVN